MQRANRALRDELRDNDIPLWKLAHEIGVTECTIVRWLREELTGERLERIQAAMKNLIKG